MYGLSAENILVNSKKICGILTEVVTSEDIVEFVIIGLGLNANVDLDAFPASIRNSLTSLRHELDYSVSLETLLGSILKNFEHRYKRLQQGFWTELLEEWKSLAKFLGKGVKIISDGEVLEGRALDVDEEGSLTVRLRDGRIRRVLTGDVTFARRHP